MLKEEMKRLASEFGLTENVDQEIADQLQRAEKLDAVDTVTFGLETDDDKIVKVFVNAKDAEKFEKLMADCLGSTDSIEDAINKAAAELDIVDVEWPDEEEEEEEPMQGSEVMDPAVHGKENKDKEKTVAKKDETSAKTESLSYGERFAHLLTEDEGAVSARMMTPNQQLVYQAVLDLGIPELAMDRSPYRSAIIKGLRVAALELQGNGTAKAALKTFIKQRIDDKANKPEEEVKPDDAKEEKSKAKPVDPKDKQVNPKDSHADSKEAHVPPKAPVKEDVAPGPREEKVTMSEAEDGMLISDGTLDINLTLEELERVLKAVQERATTVIGDVTVSPRSSGLILKLRSNPHRILINAPELAEFKELAGKLLGE